MKGFVFFDLDGTLLNGESKVDVATAEAIQTLKDNGYEPFIATGRSPAETRDIMESANIHSGIFMNGQVVLYQEQIVYSSEIPTETVEKFHQMVKDDGYGLTVYNHEQFYLVEASAGAKDAYGFIHSNPPALKEDFYKENPINMMLFISLPPAEKKYKVAFQNLDFLRNTPYSVDVISKGNSKAEGIKRFLEHLNQVDAKTFAFGDGPNDIEMLQAVQHPVAMGNALPILKEIAEFITTDNTDNGIVNGLKHYGLI
jgi:cof-like hydrolase